ncbi:MAG: thiamine pyrophosphate-dependent enzyme, partial [Desulfobacterales bacterium]|nr:thiamine pyrophosphate-dependent enzyme [Desulfobacterales bacterium]
NQGMLMESINLASVWKLPVLFVCKDDGWAITASTRPGDTTGGTMEARVRGLGVEYIKADGLDAAQVWQAAQPAIQRARKGEGPSFLHASCVHLEGHFLGLLLLRITRDPLREMPGIAGPLIQSFLRPGARTLRERLAGVEDILSTIQATMRDPRRLSSNDPVERARGSLQSDPQRLNELENSIELEIAAVLATALPGGDA